MEVEEVERIKIPIYCNDGKYFLSAADSEIHFFFSKEKCKEKNIFYLTPLDGCRSIENENSDI